MKEVRLVHILGTMSVGDNLSAPFKLWATPNKDQTESEDVKIFVGTKGQTQIYVHANVSYQYQPSQNTVRTRPGKQLTLMPWFGSKFFETVKSKAKDWSVTLEKDPQTGQACALVTCSHEPMGRSWWLQFDQETKMLTRFKQWNNNAQRARVPRSLCAGYDSL